MKRVRFKSVGAALLAGGFLGGCAEQTRSRIDVDPRAADALRKMSAAIGGARSFSFRATTTMDEPVATGQLAQFSRENRIVVQRPDRLLAEGRQDEDALLLWYESQTLTLFDKTANTYAALRVPGRIDEMLDDVAKKHGLTLPLADLLLADPYKALTENALTGRYVGQQALDGVKCHHLLFTQEAIDWQIWIDATREPVPLRLVIDYKSLPERPQFTAQFSDWNLSAPIAADQFKAAVPGGAKKVEIAQLLESGRGE